MFKLRLIAISAIAVLIFIATAQAGVTNPNISVIGQFLIRNTDDPNYENANTPTLNLGETELVFDAYLNPYVKGAFVFSIDPVEGLDVEEAYATMFKGLPGTLTLKGGKYRVGFGKLNPVHPHAYPFIEAPRVLPSMLPGGEDGFKDTGIHASVLLPSAGSWASDLSVDALNGAPFHPDEIKAAAAWLSRWSNSVLINDTTPLEIGASAMQGTNNVLWKTRTDVYGADVKTKIPLPGQARLTLQGEYFYNNTDVVVDTTTGSYNPVGRWGYYAFANLDFWQRCNAGMLYEQYQPQEAPTLTNRSIKYFIGYSLMEETTLLRLAYDQFMPDGASVVHTWTLQVLFSMGPHKAHQF